MSMDPSRPPLNMQSLRDGVLGPPSPWRRLDVVPATASTNGDLVARAMAGEDVDLLVRLARKGAKIVWSETAPVFEPVQAERLSLRWLLLRGFSGGQAFARYTISGGFNPIGRLGCCVFFLRAWVQLLIAAALALFSWTIGRHHAAAWLVKASANLGKLSVLSGLRYAAYARRS